MQYENNFPPIGTRQSNGMVISTGFSMYYVIYKNCCGNKNKCMHYRSTLDETNGLMKSIITECAIRRKLLANLQVTLVFDDD